MRVNASPWAFVPSAVFVSVLVWLSNHPSCEPEIEFFNQHRTYKAKWLILQSALWITTILATTKIVRWTTPTEHSAAPENRTNANHFEWASEIMSLVCHVGFDLYNWFALAYLYWWSERPQWLTFAPDGTVPIPCSSIVANYVTLTYFILHILVLLLQWKTAIVPFKYFVVMFLHHTCMILLLWSFTATIVLRWNVVLLHTIEWASLAYDILVWIQVGIVEFDTQTTHRIKRFLLGFSACVRILTTIWIIHFNWVSSTAGTRTIAFYGALGVLMILNAGIGILHLKKCLVYSYRAPTKRD